MGLFFFKNKWKFKNYLFIYARALAGEREPTKTPACSVLSPSFSKHLAVCWGDVAASLFPECRATQRRHIPACPPSTVGIPDAAGRMTVRGKKSHPGSRTSNKVGLRLVSPKSYIPARQSVWLCWSNAQPESVSCSYSRTGDVPRNLWFAWLNHGLQFGPEEFPFH